MNLIKSKLSWNFFSVLFCIVQLAAVAGPKEEELGRELASKAFEEFSKQPGEKGLSQAKAVLEITYAELVKKGEFEIIIRNYTLEERKKIKSSQEPIKQHKEILEIIANEAFQSEKEVFSEAIKSLSLASKRTNIRKNEYMVMLEAFSLFQEKEIKEEKTNFAKVLSKQFLHKNRMLDLMDKLIEIKIEHKIGREALNAAEIIKEKKEGKMSESLLFLKKATKAIFAYSVSKDILKTLLEEEYIEIEDLMLEQEAISDRLDKIKMLINKAPDNIEEILRLDEISEVLYIELKGRLDELKVNEAVDQNLLMTDSVAKSLYEQLKKYSNELKTEIEKKEVNEIVKEIFVEIVKAGRNISEQSVLEFLSSIEAQKTTEKTLKRKTLVGLVKAKMLLESQLEEVEEELKVEISKITENELFKRSNALKNMLIVAESRVQEEEQNLNNALQEMAKVAAAAKAGGEAEQTALIEAKQKAAQAQMAYKKAKEVLIKAAKAEAQTEIVSEKEWWNKEAAKKLLLKTEMGRERLNKAKSLTSEILKLKEPIQKALIEEQRNYK